MAPKKESSSTSTSSKKKVKISDVQQNNWLMNDDPDRYDEEVQIMLEILKASSLYTPLTATTTSVPLSWLYKAHKSAILAEDHIEFELIDGTLGRLDQSIFEHRIGVSSLRSSHTIFYQPSDDQLLDLMKEIGFSDENPRLAYIFKVHFPTRWHFVIQVIIRCLSGKVGSMNSIVSTLISLIWGLYHNILVDVGEILWNDFKKYINKTKMMSQMQGSGVFAWKLSIPLNKSCLLKMNKWLLQTSSVTMFLIQVVLLR